MKNKKQKKRVRVHVLLRKKAFKNLSYLFFVDGFLDLLKIQNVENRILLLTPRHFFAKKWPKCLGKKKNTNFFCCYERIVVEGGRNEEKNGRRNKKLRITQIYTWWVI